MIEALLQAGEIDLILSVIVITKDNFLELVATIESLYEQENLEIIVIDGGTCAKSQVFLQQVRLKYSRFKFICEKDSGISDAFNRGLKQVTGDAVNFLNSGDILISASYYPRAMNILQLRPEIEFVHADILFGDSLAGTLVLKPSLSNLGRGMPYRHQAMIFRLTVFEKLGGFSVKLKATMDFDLVCRMHKEGMLGFYDQTEAVVKMDGGGISSTRELLGYREHDQILTQHGLWNFSNVLGTCTRYLFFAVRKILLFFKLKRVVVELKQFKRRI